MNDVLKEFREELKSSFWAKSKIMALNRADSLEFFIELLDDVVKLSLTSEDLELSEAAKNCVRGYLISNNEVNFECLEKKEKELKNKLKNLGENDKIERKVIWNSLDFISKKRNKMTVAKPNGLKKPVVVPRSRGRWRTPLRRTLLG